MKLPACFATAVVAALALIEPSTAFASEAVSQCIKTHDDLPYRVRMTMCRCLADKSDSVRGWVEFLFIAKAIREASYINSCRSSALSEVPTLPPVGEQEAQISRTPADVTGSLAAPRSWLFPRPRDPVRIWPSNVESP
ncbi:hypothetical protein [Bosea massiliensis]|uniref:Secreted protein n=1 Tax=Bosea massiliensis TaxID=151419 RepID=A0ABW0P9D1_9HYPH